MALTFRDFMRGLAQSLPQVANTIYQYNTMVIEQEYRQQQMALDVRRTEATEKYYSTAEKMAAVELIKAEAALPYAVELEELKVEQARLLKEATAKDNTFIDNRQQMELEEHSKRIELVNAQLSQIDSANLDAETKRIIDKTKIYGTQMQMNIDNFVVYSTMADPRHFKLFQQAWSEETETAEYGIVDPARVFARFKELGGEQLSPIQTKSLDRFGEQMSNMLTGRLQSVLSMAELEARFLMSDEEGAAQARKSAIDTNKKNIGLINAYIQNGIKSQTDRITMESTILMSVDSLTRILDNIEQAPDDANILIKDLPASTPQWKTYFEESGSGLPGMIWDVQKKIPKTTTDVGKWYMSTWGKVFPQLDFLDAGKPEQPDAVTGANK